MQTNLSTFYPQRYVNNLRLILRRFRALFYALPYIDTILYINALKTKKKYPFEVLLF
jgi:hypothetical protein